MSFEESVVTCFREKYATFQGRATRSEYWWFQLAALVIVAISTILSLVVHPILGLGVFALIIPSLAVSVRRLHDIGKSGWWMLIGLIPVVGGLIFLYFMIRRSQPSDNAYGTPLV